jgi:uncharacterized protein YbjT (DUF2867 family)
MNPNARTILVTGATGHQGGAAARHLIADGWNVRALVRDAEKPEALALTDAGAELILGDLDDPASIEAAVWEAHGVYGVQAASSVEAEAAQFKHLANAAKAADVQHFVYSSVIGADRESTVPWVAAKVENEHYLRLLQLPLTIWRPVTFMENLLDRQKSSILGGRITGAEPPDVLHQWIAVDDIGRFVALAFAHPEVWVGRATEIAGDELSGRQAAAVLSRTLEIPVAYEQLAHPVVDMPAPAPQAPDAPPPNRADIAKLRESIPDLLTMDVWAAKQHESGAW